MSRWTSKHGKNMVAGEYGKTVDNPDVMIHERTGQCAGPGYVSDNVVMIQTGYAVNGSGSMAPKAFGGAKRWPMLTLRMEYPADRPELSAAFAVRLREVIDTFMLDYKLNAPGDNV